MILANLNLIDQAAEKIKQQLDSGEIAEACCMASVATPVTESWEAAQHLEKNMYLSKAQKQKLMTSLNVGIQQQLKVNGYDNFDLIYERLLQLVAPP